MSLKSDPNSSTELFGSDDIRLRVISDWPFNNAMESLLPKYGPVANGAKCKVRFDVTDVTLCKHSEMLGHFSSLTISKLSENARFKSSMPLKVLGIAGKQNLAPSHVFHAMKNQSVSKFELRFVLRRKENGDRIFFSMQCHHGIAECYA